MASKVERPVVFPLSNPYDRAELFQKISSAGQMPLLLVATGTEFPPVSLKGRTFKIAQCNNFYIFPAIGLAVTAQRQNE